MIFQSAKVPLEVWQIKSFITGIDQEIRYPKKSFPNTALYGYLHQKI